MTHGTVFALPTVRGRHANGAERMGFESMTPAEHRAIQALIQCGWYQPAAEALGIGYQTLKNHISAVLRKLDCQSSVQAVVRYDRWRRDEAWPAVERRLGIERRGQERRTGIERRTE